LILGPWVELYIHFTSQQQKQRAMMDCVAAAEGRVHPPQGKVAHQTSLNPAARFSDTIQYDRTALGTELTDYLGQAKRIFRGSDPENGGSTIQNRHQDRLKQSNLQPGQSYTWVPCIIIYKELHN
jgi:hypothetical protein